MVGERTLIVFRRSSSGTQKQIKAMQGNCKIYCSKLNYGILVKHNILNFCGSITGLLNYSRDQGMMWNTLAPVLQTSKSGTMQRNEGLDVFPGDGCKDTHHLGSHLMDVCLQPPFSWWIQTSSICTAKGGGQLQRFWSLLWDQISSVLDKDTELSGSIRMNANGFCSHFSVNRYSAEEGSFVQGKVHYINMYWGEANQNED